MSYEEIYDNSYERVLAHTIDNKDFFEAFYDSFVNFSDEIRIKFIDVDMTEQKAMLKRSFYSLLVFYGSNQGDDYLKKIARSHSQQYLNIEPHLYDDWLNCMMLTLQQYDPLFSKEIELAWRLVMSPGMTYMKFSYETID